MFTALLNALGMTFAMGWEPVATRARLCAVRRHSGNRLAPGDESSSTRRQPVLDRHRAGAWGRRHAGSSCSYAAVAIARSIFRKGANFS